MNKFFIDPKQINQEEITILGEDVNHIKNVLRLGVKDKIVVCDKEAGQSYQCMIEKMNQEDIKCHILNKITTTMESDLYIHIFQGLPKSDKLEWIIEKCTEIGVKEITPVIMKRCVVKLNDQDQAKKRERWKRIAEGAAKQSKRDAILLVNPIINFQNILENIKDYDIVIVAYENEREHTLKKVLHSMLQKNKNKIAVIIGPEGGIDEQEIALCQEKNIIPVTLGKRILRTETAPLVVASNILYEWEE